MSFLIYLCPVNKQLAFYRLSSQLIYNMSVDELTNIMSEKWGCHSFKKHRIACYVTYH